MTVQMLVAIRTTRAPMMDKLVWDAAARESMSSVHGVEAKKKDLATSTLAVA